MHSEIVALRKSLEKRVGVSIDSIARCRQVENWLRTYEIQVSYSTLSRLFGLNPSVVQPREQTLDALARAVGFPDYKTFCKRQHPRPSVLRFQSDLLFQLEVYITSEDSLGAVQFFLKAIEENVSNCFLALHLGKYLYSQKGEYEEELKRLAGHPLGRRYFYQFYIDEDDLNGAFAFALKKYFLPNAQKEEALFVHLYLTRKEVMKGKVLATSYVDELNRIILGVQSLHLRSRLWEIAILNEWLLHAVVNEQKLVGILNGVLSELYGTDFRGEECAAVGRICRALLFTQSSNALNNHYDWITACRQVVFGTFSDLEFQSAAQRFLQQGSNFLGNQQMIYQSDWPNAYFTSQLFLQANSALDKNVKFFSRKLGIEERFILNLLSVNRD